MSSLVKRTNLTKEKSIHIDGNLFIIVCISLISILGVTSISPVMPIIAKGLNVPPQQIGLIMAVFLIPTTAGAFMFGALADSVGIKKILIPSLLLFGAGGILCTFSQDFRSLLEWRFLTGIGAASLDTLELTIISSLYSGKMLTAAMGLNAAAIGIAATIYPVIGGVLGGLSWRYPFLLSILAFPLALLICIKLKLSKKQKNAQTVNFKGYLKNIWESINDVQVFVLLFTVFVLFVVEFATCYAYIPIYAGTYLNASGAEIGIIICCFPLAMAFTASQLGLLTRWISEKRLIVFGCILCALSVVLVPVIHSPWLLTVPCVIFGISQALAFPPLQAILAETAPEGYRAGFMALNVTVQSLGRSVGPLFAGITFGFWGIQGVFYTSTALVIITTVVFSLLVAQRVPKCSHS
ncbi:MFS transporter [Aetokthonos hydrillicola Thurmond2011]|jgi:MFS family permease|uniref:MFS transporter n=1 Tax=Aetokthonos hydrillicola Thurmond2011 TaxID=2712845 RepID=A0AAP5I9W4_9CYAN|nr:MFS transporter [Aetokthonos hydrillicola]MBO3458228.1 MFS transporter [Aetokthonos hydrillicola CCALA 1050]MBW4584447.1 MFS transporter [Aetokthonos hydrillicola CCALA 1050]MDR9896409.1 MFS transporter [Aetokthonos hydrillicola Thurmond2011]